MKRLLALAFSCLVLCASCLAQQTGPNEPASKEEIESYLEAVHSHEMMIKIMSAMSKPMHEMIHEQYLKDKDKLPLDFEQHMNQQMDDMMKDMPVDEINQAMVPTYQKHFNKSDIDAMLAFYSSPTGQKILNEMPAIMAETTQNLVPIMSKYMDTVKQRMQQEVTRLKQQTPVKPSANPPASPN
jgi:uncharacterized protein